eukprot:TRINITY_DN7894_c0_g2_i3.p1 TRINITY_DN7894_c0_g2~~TRINITY_DN7894_c0_g2_i3.p1  ORF type:complete len:285 (+),score=40.05 TRINITY_DN7894_c0_g2_i3:63-857(+)
MKASLHLKVVPFLGTVDVARWRAVDASTRSSFEVDVGKNVWMTCAANEFPGMIGAKAFFAGAHRTAILRCHMLCCRANCAMGETLYIDKIENAASLARHLSTAFSACAAHRAFTGGNAHVLLGHINMEHSRRGTSFRFGTKDRPSLCGLPAGVLEVRTYLDGGDQLMFSMKYTIDMECEFRQHLQATPVRGTVDLVSVLPSMMSFCDLALDGSWNFAARGRHVTTPARIEAYAGCEMLCVLRVMEGDHAMTRENSFVSSSEDSD